MFLETSAMTGEKVPDCFLQCARMILSKIDSGTIDPYRMYSGIQCGRSLAANRFNRDQNSNSADEQIHKSTPGCGSC
ncbi:unnamed protein product [Rotaria magnacalcarata]|nr:unnamed protein product [Rotaria magnacalcarata]